MLASSSGSEWSNVADSLLIGSIVAFVLLYVPGLLLYMRSAWTLPRYLVMETISCLPALGALLKGALGNPTAIVFVILAWPMMPTGLAIPFLIQSKAPPSTVEDDRTLRWNLRGKRK